MSESQQPMKMESYLPIRFFEKQQTNKKPFSHEALVALQESEIL